MAYGSKKPTRIIDITASAGIHSVLILYFKIKLNFIEPYSSGLGQQSIKEHPSTGLMQYLGKPASS